MNVYAYVGGNTANGVDPLGLFSVLYVLAREDNADGTVWLQFHDAVRHLKEACPEESVKAVVAERIPKEVLERRAQGEAYDPS